MQIDDCAMNLWYTLVNEQEKCGELMVEGYIDSAHLKK